MTRRLALLMVFAALSGCRCRPSGPVDPIQLGLRVSPTSIDFGRALEGSVKTATLTLTAETRAPVSVTLTTASPFGSPANAEVPGGGDTTITVTFRAGAEVADGALQLQVGDLMALVPLHGVGVRPPDCRPSAECIVSTYSLEEDRCIESQAADDAPCDPSSVCLEQGRCHSGQCLGVARRCDDNDACTDDACAMDLGCIHTPHACPAPGEACKVATCDPRAGCGVGLANDGVACGAVDCVAVNFCVQGVCTQQPTPEGLPCAPAIACLPEAECHNQQCTRVTEGDWVPDWTARLQGTPTGPLASSGVTLFFSMCVDAVPDAGPVVDGGADAGELDAGLDAGAALVCGLSSYTGSGFERFTQAYEDDAPRTLVAINDDGVVLWRDGGLEVRASNSGALRQSYPYFGTREQLVVTRTSLITNDDAGLHLRTDGGAQWLGWGDVGAELARSSALFTWNSDAGVLTRYDTLDDGGLQVLSVTFDAGLSARLAVSGDVAVFGGEARAQVRDDGGVEFVAFDWRDAGPVSRVFEGQTLVSSSVTNVFFERCDGGCEQVVRAFDTQTGASLWEVPVITARTPGTMLTSALVAVPVGGVMSVVRLDDLDGGHRAEFQFLAAGDRKAVCRLADGDLEQAHLSAGALVVTARRADGGVVLESYGLGALPFSLGGWPTVNGLGGSRSDRR